MLQLLAASFFFGMIFNAAPGVVFAETIRFSLRGGYIAALNVQLGSLVGDATWAILGLVGVGLALQIESLRFPVAFLSVIYFLWLAYDSWQSSNKEYVVDNIEAAGKAYRHAFLSGVILSLTNPQNIAYWAVLGGAMASLGIKDPEPSDYIVFFVGFMLASVVWSFICAGIVASIFEKAKGAWCLFIYRSCAVLFLVLATSNILEVGKIWRASLI